MSSKSRSRRPCKRPGRRQQMDRQLRPPMRHHRSRSRPQHDSPPRVRRTLRLKIPLQEHAMPISSARRRAERHPTGIGPVGIATSRGPPKTNISSSNPGKLARARAIPRSKREARVGRGPPAGHIATGGIPAGDTVPPIAAIRMSPTPGIGSMIRNRDMPNVRRRSRFRSGGCSGRIDAKLTRASEAGVSKIGAI